MVTAGSPLSREQKTLKRHAVCTNNTITGTNYVGQPVMIWFYPPILQATVSKEIVYYDDEHEEEEYMSTHDMLLWSGFQEEQW